VAAEDPSGLEQVFLEQADSCELTGSALSASVCRRLAMGFHGQWLEWRSP